MTNCKPTRQTCNMPLAAKVVCRASVGFTFLRCRQGFGISGLGPLRLPAYLWAPSVARSLFSLTDLWIFGW